MSKSTPESAFIFRPPNTEWPTNLAAKPLLSGYSVAYKHGCWGPQHTSIASTLPFTFTTFPIAYTWIQLHNHLHTHLSKYALSVLYLSITSHISLSYFVYGHFSGIWFMTLSLAQAPLHVTLLLPVCLHWPSHFGFVCGWNNKKHNLQLSASLLPDKMLTL